MASAGDTVDREATTKENDDVDRYKMTAEADEVDRVIATQELIPHSDGVSTIIFYIHPIPAEKSALLKGIAPPQSLRFLVGKGVVFGRGKDVDVFLNDDKASLHHMELTAMVLPNLNMVFKLRKLTRKSITLLVNNETLKPGGEMFLKTSDVIRINELTLTVQIHHDYSSANMHYDLEFQMLPCQGMQLPTAGLPQAAMSPAPVYFPQPTGIPQGSILGPQSNMLPGAVSCAPNPFSPSQQQPVFMLLNPAPNIYNNPRQPHITVQERREIFQQNPMGHVPTENEDVPIECEKQLSVEETELPKLVSKTSFEDTQPPKSI